MAYLTIKELNKLTHKKAKAIAQRQGTARQWHPSYNDIKNHPQCETAGCRNPKNVLDWHWTSGKPVYRPVCQECHKATTVERYATKTGADWVRTIEDVIAHKAGFTSSADYLNSRHPYRKYRKDYCENKDGRLGYPCTTTIPKLPTGKLFLGLLDVDHIDENPGNNSPKNLQTLCRCCHAYKSHRFVLEHGQTAGRKTLGITY